MRDGVHRRDRRELERALKAVAAYDLVSGSRKLDGLGRGVRTTDVELRIGVAGGVRRTMRCILAWLVESARILLAKALIINGLLACRMDRLVSGGSSLFLGRSGQSECRC